MCGLGGEYWHGAGPGTDFGSIYFNMEFASTCGMRIYRWTPFDQKSVQEEIHI